MRVSENKGRLSARAGAVELLDGAQAVAESSSASVSASATRRFVILSPFRFLVAAPRYDKLLETHSKEELDSWNLLRVSEDFRVIALGHPVPKYPGNALDPPLRSRFQGWLSRSFGILLLLFLPYLLPFLLHLEVGILSCILSHLSPNSDVSIFFRASFSYFPPHFPTARDVSTPPYNERLEELQRLAPRVDSDRVARLLGFVTALGSKDVGAGFALLDFPADLLPDVARVLDRAPSVSAHALIKRVYPYETMMKEEGQKITAEALKKFDLLEPEVKDFRATKVEAVSSTSSSSSHFAADVTLTSASTRKTHSFSVKRGTKPLEEEEIGGFSSSSSAYIANSYHESVLGELMQSHAVRDFCLVGPKGCGKTEVINRFASVLGYDVAPILLYADMSARDLLQTRTTTPAGDTVWIQSPLVRAAVEGRLAVLDGIHRLHRSTLATLSRLVHDRETTLFDGTRLLDRAKYDAVARKTGWTEEEMGRRKILPIHPAFRIAALAEPPVLGGTASQAWLGAEQLTLFFYHQMRPLGIDEETDVIVKSVPNLRKNQIDPLLKFTETLRESKDPTLKSLSASLSTRQLLRTARQMASFDQSTDGAAPDVRGAVEKACLSRFLPALAKNALEESLEKAGIEKAKNTMMTTGSLVEDHHHLDASSRFSVEDGALTIGSTTVRLTPHAHDDAFLIPDNFVFYENAQHTRVLEAMLRDFALGEHLLLVGNQGVGKNKIVDRFLQLMRRPREYVQLHRDTTVRSCV